MREESPHFCPLCWSLIFLWLKRREKEEEKNLETLRAFVRDALKSCEAVKLLETSDSGLVAKPKQKGKTQSETQKKNLFPGCAR